MSAIDQQHLARNRRRGDQEIQSGNKIPGLNATAQWIAHVHFLTILLALSWRLQHQSGRDGIDPNASGGESSRSNVRKACKSLFRKRVAQEVGVRSSKLRIEQVYDECVTTGVLRRQRLRQQHGRPDVGVHV